MRNIKSLILIKDMNSNQIVNYILILENIVDDEIYRFLQRLIYIKKNKKLVNIYLMFPGRHLESLVLPRFPNVSYRTTKALA